MRSVVAAFALIGASVAMGHAAAVAPPSGVLAFDVIRKGEDIGDQTMRFARNGDALTVTIRTDIALKAPFFGVVLYKFVQDSAEVWTRGKLTSLRTATDDDGDASEISLGASDLVTASLWNRDVTGARTILNTIHGTPMTVAVADLGEEVVQAGGKPVVATHYKITGELAREVWYDAAGVLTKVSIKAEDGSTVDYVLK